MITFLSGTDSFEIERLVAARSQAFKGTPEKIDGSELQPRDLPDLLMGATLFADKRLVIIKDISENKSIWPTLYEWFPRISDDIDLILVEAKPDKRTTTYREIKKIADVIDVAPWEDRDADKAELWVQVEAKKLGLTLDKNLARLIVRRTGLEKWQLFHSLEKLSIADQVNQDTIELLIDPQPKENVFHLFTAAINGDKSKVSSMIRTLELSEDPYKLFGLLSSQVFQLAVVSSASKSEAVSRDFGIHPYVAGQLQVAAKKLGHGGVKKVVAIFAHADDDLKTSRGEPWLLIERALLEVSII